MIQNKMARPVLVPTEKSTLHLTKNNRIIESTSPTGKSDLYNCIPQKLILISIEPDEKFKVGDKLLSQLGNPADWKIITFDESFDNSVAKYHKKILAQQHKLPLNYIETFITEYNQGIIKDFILEYNSKVELKDIAKDFVENTMLFSFNSMETRTTAKRMLRCVEFGANWQKAQDEEMLFDLYKTTCLRLTNSFTSYDIEWFNNNITA